MERSYWLRQATDTPLFPDILWSRPENKAQAARVTLIGGHAHDMQSVVRLHTLAIESGAGQTRIVLPDALARLVPGAIPEVTYVSSTHAGAISKESVSTLLAAAAWGQVTILSSDLGHSSETAIAVESLVANTDSRFILVGSAASLFSQNTDLLLKRPDTALVLSFEQLQKVARANGEMLLSTLPLMQFVEHLHRLSKKWDALVIVHHLQQFIVAYRGNISTTKGAPTLHWQEQVAAALSALWPHNPSKLFEAATSSVLIKK